MRLRTLIAVAALSATVVLSAGAAPPPPTTLAGTIDLVRRGIINRHESVVVCVTGNGYKTAEVVKDRLAAPVRLSRAFKDFEAWWESKKDSAFSAASATA